jgi:DNA polymerase
MANDFEKQDNVTFIADALRRRICWEVENGCAGYVRAEVPQTDLIKKPGPESQEIASDQSPLPTEDPERALLALREEIGDCTRCGLSEKRQHLVFGEGSPTARLVFVGEGPGRDEDLSGRPFVGAAGQLLDRIIAAINLERKDVYICNVVKCRPPNNRAPGEDESAICGSYMLAQLAVIKPEIVVALGATAAKFLLKRNESLGRQRGRFHQVGVFKIMPTYHPAYLLRNPQSKRAVWEDMQKVASALGLDVATRGGGNE